MYPEMRSASACFVVWAIASTFAILSLVLRGGTSPPTPLTELAASRSSARASSESTAAQIRVDPTWTQLSAGTYSLGTAGLPRGSDGHRRSATGFVRLVYAKGMEPKELAGSVQMDAPANGSVTTPSCHELIGHNAPWQMPMRWIIDPTNGDGIDTIAAVDAFWGAVNEFEERLPSGVFIGQDTAGCADGIDTSSPDGKNEFMFGFIQIQGVLGLMSGWIDDSTGALIETDIVLNLHSQWGDSSTESGVYDLQNVMAHEIGHAYGMGHIQVQSATMEPTAGIGEMHKRTLLNCEAVGLCQMYGHANTQMCMTPTRAPLVRFIDVGDGARCGGGGVSTPPRSSSAPMRLSLGSIISIVAMVAIAV